MPSKQYTERILPKATVYNQTKLVKLLNRGNDDLMAEKLMSIILYTDYSHLSSHFSSTFRKRDKFETQQAVKKRHRNYYWLSRRLKEAVKDCGSSYGYKGKNEFNGPFYCGMSTVMKMPQFNIKLLSPTSTSCQLTVALKFSGDYGIIIDFDNDKGSAMQLKGLDVSWISGFPEEDERYTQVHYISLYVSSY